MEKGIREKLRHISKEKHRIVFAVIENGKIHLEERTEPGDRFFEQVIVPGGTVDKGETIRQALLREVFEEREVVPTEVRKLGIVNEIVENNILNIMHVYLITKYQGRINNREGRNKQFWTDLSQVKELCKHPLSKRILDLVLTSL